MRRDGGDFQMLHRTALRDFLRAMPEEDYLSR